MAERIEIGEIELAYEDAGGDGPAVVLVHGLGGSLYGWRAQVTGARRGRLPGHRLRPARCGAEREAAGSVLGRGLGGRPRRAARRARDRAGGARRALDGLHGRVEQAALALGERCWALALCGGRASWPEAAVETFDAARRAGARGADGRGRRGGRVRRPQRALPDGAPGGMGPDGRLDCRQRSRCLRGIRARGGTRHDAGPGAPRLPAARFRRLRGHRHPAGRQPRRSRRRPRRARPR